MIPQKQTADTNLDKQLDKDIANAEKKSKEDIKKGKPKLAQAVATKWLKFIIIGVAGLGLAYKMFFSSSGEEQKVVKKKVNVVSKKKEDEQKIMADAKIAKSKGASVNKDKEEIKKIISITDQTISNSEVISSVSVPKLTLPNVPSVPQIEKIAVKEDEQKKIDKAIADTKLISENEIKKLQQEKAELEKKLAQKQDSKDSIDNKSKKNNKNKKKNSKNKKNSKSIKDDENENDDSNNFSSISSSIDDVNSVKGLKIKDGELDNLASNLPNDKKKGNKKAGNIPNSKGGKNKTGDPAKDALNEMFILAGSGPKTKEKSSSSSGGKNDFIIFDGSTLSEQDVVSENNSSIQKLSNLENTIATGKIIEAVLETAITTESAGTARAIVSKDVYGETGRKILIPMGSRMFGSYTTTSTTTQTRLLLTWNKVIRPDGIVITMQGDTYDQRGKKGLEGDIDTRYGELLKNSLLYSFITMGSAIAIEKLAGIKGSTQFVGTGGTVTTTSPATMAAQSVITTVEDIVDKMTDGMTDELDPVISVPQGLLLKVMSSTDIVVGTAYKRRYNNLELE